MREIILTSVGILVFIYMSVMNFIFPYRDKVSSLLKEVEQIKGEADAIAKFNEVIRQNQRQQVGPSIAQQSQSGSKDLRVQLIQRNKRAKYRNITDFLEEVTSPFFRSSVNIDSLKYDKTLEVSGYTSTKFEVVLNGRFPRVLNFIKKLELIEALVTVDNIEFMIDKADSFSVTVKLMGTYYQIENDQV